MIKLGSQFTIERSTAEEEFKLIMNYLADHQLVIVNIEEVPLRDEEVLNSLLEKEVIHFSLKSVADLELDTVRNVLQYIETAEYHISLLDEEADNKVIFQAFVDVMEALDYFSSLSDYLKLNAVNSEKLHNISLKGLQQMEQENEEYILELLQYECLPMLMELRTELVEGTTP